MEHVSNFTATLDKILFFHQYDKVPGFQEVPPGFLGHASPLERPVNVCTSTHSNNLDYFDVCPFGKSLALTSECKVPTVAQSHP